jgi:hypothetical protein
MRVMRRSLGMPLTHRVSGHKCSPVMLAPSASKRVSPEVLAAASVSQELQRAQNELILFREYSEFT